MIVIANVFQKLQTLKILVRRLSKKGRFRKRFDSQHVEVSKILAKSPSEQFYSVFYHSERKWSGKILQYY